ncbi:MAG: hypothetical protein ACP5QG_08525 [candidate division WOR-3 bacterium]
MFTSLIGILFVQTPSQYLGITVGKTAVYSGRYKHNSYTGGTDTARMMDTMRVTETFTYNGHEAFRIFNVRHTTAGTNIDTAFTDSAWNDPPWLMARGRVSDTISRDVFHMRTPFTKGDSWSTGIEGNYRDNFDGYPGLDLMEIRSEIVTVEDSEIVSVPAGTFFTWRLKKDTRVCIKQCSNPVLDSVLAQRITYMWWSPGNCVVKDTTATIATAYVLGNPMLDETYESRSLTYISGVDEASRSEGPVKLLSPNPTWGFIVLSRPPAGMLCVEIYDPAGKLTLSGSVSDGSEMALDISAFPVGVYFLKASLDSRPALFARVIKTR